MVHISLVQCSTLEIQQGIAEHFGIAQVQRIKNVCDTWALRLGDIVKSIHISTYAKLNSYH
jgi:hypothetical protein